MNDTKYEPVAWLIMLGARVETFGGEQYFTTYRLREGLEVHHNIAESLHEEYSKWQLFDDTYNTPFTKFETEEELRDALLTRLVRYGSTG